MNNISTVLENKSDCTGCGACLNACTFHAVTMTEDLEGFFYPAVDPALCTDCGQCRKVCPALGKSAVYRENSAEPECYAAIGSNELRKVSSSGGAFSVMAGRILAAGGAVCGAAFSGHKVRHIIISNAAELHRLRGSKYLQSDTGTVFTAIRDLLRCDRKVLFSGTPCQVAALNLFLGRKYDNLYTVDLICHGVPPQRMFDRYLQETIGEKSFVDVSFRDKRAGWKTSITINTWTAEYHESAEESAYLQAFLQNMCPRPSCGTCKYTSTRREADITIGDFWAVERYKPGLNDHKGTSLILLNNRKGRDFYEKIKNDFPIQEKVPLEYAKYYNITLYTPLKQHPKRNIFFRMFNEGKSLKEITGVCSSGKYDAGILNFWVFRNMGGVIQAWALQNVVRSLGYSAVLLNYSIPDHQVQYSGSFVERFAAKYLDISELYTSGIELARCNEYLDTVILGSDCIWANWWDENEREYSLPLFGNFVDSDKKIIAYAPSFGNRVFRRSGTMTRLLRYYLGKMDFISVREKSGVDILKNTFALDAVQVLDPTLLLETGKYDDLICRSKYDIKDHVFNYSIGIRDDDTVSQAMKRRMAAENVLTLDQTGTDQLDVEDWLYLIRHARLVLTNSYHACCFAIKFKVPFYVFPPYGLDTSRFDSLLGMLGLQDRILHSAEDVAHIRDLYAPVEWEKVEQIIRREKEHSLAWLKNALDAPKKDPVRDTADDMIRFLYEKIKVLESRQAPVVYIQQDENILDMLFYRSNYLKYLKYRICKNFVSGSTRARYRKKQRIFHEKVRNARALRNRISYPPQ